MLELVLGAGIGVIVALCLRLMARWKLYVLQMSDRYRVDFYELANQIVEWDEISEERLSFIAWLSSELKSRKAQIIVMMAMKQAQREERAGQNFRDRLPPEKNEVWSRLIFAWLVAACSQGSFLGIGALIQLVEYFKNPEKVVPKIENAALAAQAHS